MRGRRGHNQPGVIVKVLFLGVIAMTALTIVLAIRGFEKEPKGPPVGSAVIPGQAAQAVGAASTSPPRR